MTKESSWGTPPDPQPPLEKGELAFSYPGAVFVRWIERVFQPCTDCYMLHTVKHKYSTLVTMDIVCHLFSKKLWNEVNMKSFSGLDEMERRVR
jgi:hypothetical protein